MFGSRKDVGAPVPLVLYTRSNCPLCDEMKAELGRVRLPRPVEVREVDIAGDAALEKAYGLSIPVLAIGGEPLFRGRLDPAELVRAVERASDAGGRP